jgi:TRAP-type C4-dicarboxylate transport system substrate-binding protein
MNRIILCFAVVVYLLTIVVVCNQAKGMEVDHTITIRHAYESSISQENIDDTYTFFEYFEKESKGEFRVEPVSYNKFAIVDAVRSGEFQTAVVDFSQISNLDKKLNVLYAPYLFADYDTAHKVYDNYVKDYIDKYISNYNLKVLAIIDKGFVNLFSNYDIKGLEDILNKKCFLYGPVSFDVQLDKTFKCRKVHEVDFETVIDAPLIDYYNNKLYLKYRTINLTRHAFAFKVLIINRNLYNKLTQDQRDIVEKLVRRINLEYRRLIEFRENKILKELEDKGYKIVNPRVGEFIQRTKEMYKLLDKNIGAGQLFELQYNIAKVYFRGRYGED